MQHTVLQFDSRDNVLIALRDLRKGDQIAFFWSTLNVATDVDFSSRQPLR